MALDITGGIMNRAQKVVVYGPEGIGKSTFAAQFPNPVFIDTEGSTSHMDVKRLKKPSSWKYLLAEVKDVIENSDDLDTLVIDTIDWAEQMCVEDVCATHHKTGIEDFGYGNGYVYVKEEFGRFLNLLTEVIDTGNNVVLNAHAQIRKFEQPDELGAYDRYELKLGKKTSSQTSPLVKEWADMLLFANYKTVSVAADKDGKKHKAQGGSRVMYTAHHPCWDAKNRHGLPEMMPFEFDGISHIFLNQKEKQGKTVPDTVKKTKVAPVQLKKEPEQPEEKKQEDGRTAADVPPAETTAPQPETKVNERIPKELRDLMLKNHVDEWDIQMVVGAKGYYPADMPIENYAPDFIQGVLVGAWDQVHKMIIEAKKKEEVPFK